MSSLLEPHKSHKIIFLATENQLKINKQITLSILIFNDTKNSAILIKLLFIKKIKSILISKHKKLNFLLIREIFELEFHFIRKICLNMMLVCLFLSILLAIDLVRCQSLIFQDSTATTNSFFNSFPSAAILPGNPGKLQLRL